MDEMNEKESSFLDQLNKEAIDSALQDTENLLDFSTENHSTSNQLVENEIHFVLEKQKEKIKETHALQMQNVMDSQEKLMRKIEIQTQAELQQLDQSLDFKS